MIIRPRINSLKLLIVPLLLVLLTLGYYSYTSYNSITEYERFLEQENNFVALELNEIIHNYNELSVQNDSIMDQLDATRFKISRILDSVYSMEPDVNLVLGYKKQLLILKEENKRILDLVAKLNDENQRLKQEALLAEVELEASKNQAVVFSNENSTLSNINYGLKYKLKEATILRPSSISVEAIKKQTKNRLVSTTSARRTKKMNVCFTIPKNKFAKKGKQEFYLQIIDPQNNVVGDKGQVYVGKQQLIKSKTVEINYLNKEIKVCDIVEPNENESFAKGTYFVSLYGKSGLVESTKITLK